MKDIAGLTTYSTDYWEKTASVCVPTWADAFPGPIAVYAEGADCPVPPELERRELAEIDGLAEALERYKSIPFLSGQLPRGRGYDYNFDLMRFARKVYAVCDAAARHDGYLVWIDADVEFTAPLPASAIYDMAHGVFVAYAGRDPRAIAHSECSFVIYDTTHHAAPAFFSMWRDLYDHGTVLALPGFHDCFSFDTLIRDPKIPKRNFTEGVPGLDVMPRSPFAPYLIHHKGPQGKARLFDERVRVKPSTD